MAKEEVELNVPQTVDSDGINLSEKCVNVSCCIVLVSNMSKIRAFY